MPAPDLKVHRIEPRLRDVIHDLTHMIRGYSGGPARDPDTTMLLDGIRDFGGQGAR